MDVSGDLLSLVQTVSEAVLSSTTFSLLVAFLGLYCVVLFADIVLLFVLRPVDEDLKKGIFGTKERPLASARSLIREWKSIETRLASHTVSEYKVAILEADTFTNRMLLEMGYAGRDLGERLETMSPGHFRELPALREAHAIRNRIILERDFPLDRTEAARVLALYRNFLNEAEIISEIT